MKIKLSLLLLGVLASISADAGIKSPGVSAGALSAAGASIAQQNWGLPVGIGPSGSFPDAVGTYVIGQAPATAGTLSVSATSGSVTATFSAATLLGTASDVGRVITILDTTFKYCTITAQSSTTVATCTVSGGTLSGTGPFANAAVWITGTPATGTAAYSTAFPVALTGGTYLWFAANVICASGTGPCASGSAAGMHYATCPTTTVCQVFTDTLASGKPVTITSPTAFSGGNSPGAFSQSTSAQTFLTLPIPGNSMGSQGAITFTGQALRPSTANTVAVRTFYGGTQISVFSAPSVLWYGMHKTFRNMGATNLQIFVGSGATGLTDEAGINAAQGTAAIDSTQNQNLVLTGQLSTSALDYLLLIGGTITSSYSP